MKKYTKIICMIAAVCLLGAAAFCGFRIYSHYAHESKQEEDFEKIAEVVEQAQTGESETTDVLLTEEETVLAEYGELYLQNTDMVGWLSIAGTNINFPVMQTPNNPNYYLKHNFEKEYSDLGTPYVQENCDLLTSDNLVIYGHHIKGQKMFGALENYKSKDFYEEHKAKRCRRPSPSKISEWRHRKPCGVFWNRSFAERLEISSVQKDSSQPETSFSNLMSPITATASPAQNRKTPARLCLSETI